MESAPSWRNVKRDFPILAAGDFIYLDSAASAQKPEAVLNHVDHVYRTTYANIHRGLYRQSAQTTALYEAARSKVNAFINGYGTDGIVFTRNTTEAINLVAASWGGANLHQGDEILISGHEHHANIVPWQLIAQKTGAVIKVIPLTPELTLDLAAIPGLLSDRTKIVAVTHVSNAIGLVNPVAEIIKAARKWAAQARILIDGSQAVVHGPVDIRALDADFYVFTGHKLYAPTGAGVLAAKPDILAAMPPYQGGGDMIETVSFEGTTFKSGPARFEAGTPDFMAVIGLAAAIDYLDAIGMDRIAAREQELISYMQAQLAALPEVRIHGEGPRAGIFSLDIAGCHPADLAMILDQQGIAVRVGHHCCQPLMAAMGVEGTLRASFGVYTDESDVDALVKALRKAATMLRGAVTA